jgi:ABC-type transport system substrate-binding protein
VLLSTGRTHLWNLSGTKLGGWEAEIDSLMERQLGTRDMAKRKSWFDRVQRILWEQMPFVGLVSPNVLVAARKGLRNLKPGVLGHPVLWNIEELDWSGGSGSDSRPRTQ